jgi:hypothetical protein
MALLKFLDTTSISPHPGNASIKISVKNIPAV